MIYPDYIRKAQFLQPDIVTRKENHRLPDLLALLLATCETELVDDNDWDVTYWGVCNGVGENNLGKLLMKIRAEAR
jgi:predicted NAD-dependent protein-ADP-ribosyltransferase YbiA (DUF1768 family)